MYKDWTLTRNKNGQVLLGKVVHMLTQHKFTYTNLLTRVQFLNVFVISKLVYYLQLFSFSTAHLASLKKAMDYFLNSQQLLKIHRDTLHLSFIHGGMNLKDINVLSESLTLHRTLQIIASFTDTISASFYMTILKNRSDWPSVYITVEASVSFFIQ